MAHKGEPLLGICASCMGVTVGVLADPLVIQLPATASWKAVGDGWSSWSSAIHMADSEDCCYHLENKQVDTLSSLSAFEIDLKKKPFKKSERESYFNHLTIVFSPTNWNIHSWATQL